MRSSILILFLQLNENIQIIFQESYFCLKVRNTFNIAAFVIDVTKLV